tara:strand:+ start:325 stop:498 length:174 start_codon:yes stop_codon:yes gene_type:complete
LFNTPVPFQNIGLLSKVSTWNVGIALWFGVGGGINTSFMAVFLDFSSAFNFNSLIAF